MRTVRIAEFHSSDLTAPCPRSVLHRHRGEILPQMTTALFRGLAAGEVMNTIHDCNRWDLGEVDVMVRDAMDLTIKKSIDEQRPLSKGMHQGNMDAIKAEITKVAIHYIERQRDYFSNCKIIGVEIPVRWTLAIEGGEPIHFASHLDLLYRNPNGDITVRDYKFQEESPTAMAYLGRNLQFTLYHFCITEGACKVHNPKAPTDDADDWVRFGEFPWMEVVDLARFKAYSKATGVKDFETGEVLQYVKGDRRPIEQIIKVWRYSPEKEYEMKRELAERPILYRAGFFPMQPDKLGCELCESKTYCVNFIHNN